MSTYDFEPNPDDFGPEPPHIANGKRIKREPVSKRIDDLIAQRNALRVELELLKSKKPFYEMF
ncbi:hypothetical protein UFOVP1309_57 [uncultured Caudovirales phage]|uniref:Uncharacterized protein n=1 Tax=uncultured Caudovirales phage TaxID=2100421 RepID=A0A6J5RMF9_9CAUD|nr:hypothetical protein UFOVP1309_57 [uncultured Caudovirales phage]